MPIFWTAMLLSYQTVYPTLMAGVHLTNLTMFLSKCVTFPHGDNRGIHKDNHKPTPKHLVFVEKSTFWWPTVWSPYTKKSPGCSVAAFVNIRPAPYFYTLKTARKV